MLLGVATLALLAVAVFALTRSGSESTDAQYLNALDDGGLRNEFAADRQAVSNAERVCDALDSGGRPQGSEADRIGVSYYCDEYLAEFKVLETATIDGSFTIIDADSAGAVGTSCEGEGGYGDINSSTAVVVRSSAGDELARTELGRGDSASIVTCVFEFSFELTEGEDVYVLEVGDRGEVSYSWSEIRRGPELSIG